MRERPSPWFPSPASSSGGRPVRRVLMTAATSGVEWTSALELCRALGERGVSVTLATLGAPLTAAQWNGLLGVPGLRVEQSTWRAERLEDVWEDMDAAGAWLLELEARDAPDAVHLHGYRHGALPFKRRPLVVGHECPLAWGAAVRGEPALERDWLSRWEVTRGLRAAGHVVTPTSSLLDSLERHYGPLPAASVIAPARRHEDFAPCLVREPFLFSTGEWWDEARNLQVLESVAPRLDWPVLVAGGREHPQGGQMRARSVRLLGELSPSSLAGYLGRASLFVLPARHDPGGLSALEAGLAGCALVLADIPSLREMWEDAAVFVPPDDTDMLARALRRLVAEPTLRSRMSTLARTRALEFSPERMADAYLALYASLDEESQRAPSLQSQLARAT